MEVQEYLVKMIDADYAHLINTKTNDEILVAMALLPDDIDEGLYVKYENFSYSMIE